MMVEVGRLDQDSQGDCIEGEEKRTSLGGMGRGWRSLRMGAIGGILLVTPESDQPWSTVSHLTVFGGHCPVLELAKFCFEN